MFPPQLVATLFFCLHENMFFQGIKCFQKIPSIQMDGPLINDYRFQVWRLQISLQIGAAQIDSNIKNNWIHY